MLSGGDNDRDTLDKLMTVVFKGAAFFGLLKDW